MPGHTCLFFNPNLTGLTGKSLHNQLLLKTCQVFQEKMSKNRVASVNNNQYNLRNKGDKYGIHS